MDENVHFGRVRRCAHRLSLSCSLVLFAPTRCSNMSNLYNLFLISFSLQSKQNTDIFAFGQDSNGYFKNNKARKQFIGVYIYYSVAYLWNHSMPLKRENRFDWRMKCTKHTKKINKEYTKKRSKSMKMKQQRWAMCG